MTIFEPSVTYSRKEIPSVNMNGAESAFDYIKENCEYDPTVENFGVIFLNRKNMVLGHKILFKGGLNSATVDMKVLFRECFLMNCCSAFIVFHNHPSGDPAPSSADTNVTRKIREAARIIDLEFLDHIVVGEVNNDPMFRGFYSYRDAGVV